MEDGKDHIGADLGGGAALSCLGSMNVLAGAQYCTVLILTSLEGHFHRYRTLAPTTMLSRATKLFVLRKRVAKEGGLQRRTGSRP